MSGGQQSVRILRRHEELQNWMPSSEGDEVVHASWASMGVTWCQSSLQSPQDGLLEWADLAVQCMPAASEADAIACDGREAWMQRAGPTGDMLSFRACVYELMIIGGSLCKPQMMRNSKSEWQGSG